LGRQAQAEELGGGGWGGARGVGGLGLSPLNLIRLGLASFSLNINFFFNPCFTKNMMATLSPFFKPKLKKQLPQIIKGNVGIRCAAEP
jgi:hypothetical protein